MLKPFRDRRWVALISACVIGGVVAIVHAVIPDSAGVIHACYQKSSGALRVVDDPTSCKANEVALAWSQIGPQGPTGPQGPQGPQGEQGPQGIPGTSASSHAYEASNSHQIPEDTYLVGLTLPVGKYVVWSFVDIYGDDSGDANTQCGLWTAFADTNLHFHFSPGSDTAIFSGEGRDDQYFVSWMTTVTMTNTENQVLMYCTPGGDSDNRATAYGQMIAMKVDAIN